MANIDIAVELLEEVMEWHSDPQSADYNGCDKDPCHWCERAKTIIEKLYDPENFTPYFP